MKALQESITYPEMAKEAGIEGRVIVQFVVDKTGSVTKPTVAQGAHELLNKAALAAVKEQTFEPGRKEGEPVPVQMSLPVTFRLDDGSTEGSSEPSDDATTSGAP
ncbi:MAG: energy transducer TonB, partial [Bacteroidetes bacterium QH_2_63_10]